MVLVGGEVVRVQFSVTRTGERTRGAGQLRVHLVVAEPACISESRALAPEPGIKWRYTSGRHSLA